MAPVLKFAAYSCGVGVVTMARPLYTALLELSCSTKACVASAPPAQPERTPSSDTKMKLAATAALPGAVSGNVGGVVAGAVFAMTPVHEPPVAPPALGIVGCVVGLGVPRTTVPVGLAV